jgi:hypothetical protein
MFSMHACFILLTLAVSPSAPQGQTVDNRLVAEGILELNERLTRIGEFVHDWKVLSSDSQALMIQGQTSSTERQDGLRDTLEEVVAEAVGVKAQLTELVKVAQATQNLTSQLLLQCNSSQILTDLQVLKGRQAVAGAIAVAQVCMFVTYILFCLGIYLVKRCKKHQEKEKRQEFALLEKQLTESRRKRRAAAAAMNKQNPQ